MQVYISTNCLLDKLPLDKILSLYIQAGIKKIELSSYNKKLPDCPQLFSRFPAKYLVHNYFPPPKKPFVFNLASLNQEIGQQSLQLAKEAVNLCSFLNTPFYSFHGGLLFDSCQELEETTKTFKPLSPIYNKEKALKTFIKNIKILKKYAQRENVKLLIENNVCPPILKNKLLFVDEKDFLWLFAQKSIEGIGVLLDTGHLKVSAKTYSISSQKVIEKIEDKIFALHLHDNNGIADLHWKIKPNSWVVKLVKKLKKPELYFIIEARFKTIKEIIEQKKILQQL